MFDRIIYGIIGSILGALLGVLLWFLYGLGFSAHYNGPGLDPSLLHWVKFTAIGSFLIGFIFKAQFGDVLGDVFQGIFSFESSTTPDGERSTAPVLITLLILLIIVFVTAPKP